MSVVLRGSQEEREYGLREGGFTQFKPAYYQLTEAERGTLQIGNIDPATELSAALDGLPGDILLAYCKDYEDEFGSSMPTDADEACEEFDQLADLIAAELYEAQPDMLGDDNFSIPLDHLTCNLRWMLELWARENAGEFYE